MNLQRQIRALEAILAEKPWVKARGLQELIPRFDSGDEATAIEEKERVVVALEQQRMEKLLAHAAMNKIRCGTYFVCSDCGGPIPEKRLEAMPNACFCISCQEKQEQLGELVVPDEAIA